MDDIVRDVNENWDDARPAHAPNLQCVLVSIALSITLLNYFLDSKAAKTTSGQGYVRQPNGKNCS